MSKYQIEPDVVGLWGDNMDFDATRALVEERIG